MPTATSRAPWVLTAAVRRLKADAALAVARVPGRAWRRGAVTLGVGFALLLALVAGLTLATRALHGPGLQGWDERLLLETPGLMTFHAAVMLESPGNLAYLIPLTATFAVVALRRGQPLVAAAALAAYVLARPLIFLGWQLWDRPRPRLIADGVAAPGLHSFPSGHVILACAVYGLLAYLWARASRRLAERALAVCLAAGWVALIGLARVRLGTHWPSDVLAGLLIGALWLAAVVVALRRAEVAAPTWPPGGAEAT